MPLEVTCAKCGKIRLPKGKLSFLVGAFQPALCQCIGVESGARAAGRKLSRRTTLERKNTNSQGVSKSLESVQQSLLPGTIVGGNYRIIEKIGQGGMGLVYRVAHVVIGTEYALKVLAPEHINEQNWLRFQSEARTLAGLSHPNLVKVYDLGLHGNNLPFYTMDLLNGVTLETLIIEQGSLPLQECIPLFLQVLDGLSYAHRNGIIHRDLKPGNIMLSRDAAASKFGGEFSVKILDFGIAKSSRSAELGLQKLTSLGEVFGSPSYMSPEQCAGQAVDARSDIYALGCCLFEALTGYLPFDSETAVETLDMHRSAAVPALSDAAPNKKFPDSIEVVVSKCLAKSPVNRYQTARDLSADLESVRQGRVVSANPSLSMTSQSIRSLSAPAAANEQKRVLLASGATLAVVAAVSIALLYFAFKSPAVINSHPSEQSDLSNAFKKGNPEPTVNAHAVAPVNTDEDKNAEFSAKPSRPGYVRLILPKSKVFALVSSVDEENLYLSEVLDKRELSLSREYTLHTATFDPRYLNALKSVKITSLTLDDHQVLDDLDSPPDSKVQKFYEVTGRMFPVDHLYYRVCDKSYRGLLRYFPKINTILISTAMAGKLATFLSDQDIALIRSRVGHLMICAEATEQIARLLDGVAASKTLTEVAIATNHFDLGTGEKLKKIASLKELSISSDKLSTADINHLFGTKCLKELLISYDERALADIARCESKYKTLKKLTVCGAKARVLSPELMKVFANNSVKVTVSLSKFPTGELYNVL